MVAQKIEIFSFDCLCDFSVDWFDEANSCVIFSVQGYKKVDFCKKKLTWVGGGGGGC